MKPANFPERKRQRQIRARSPNAAPDSQRGVHSKKPLAGGSPARQAHHSGKIKFR